jgi:hypothetical protein
MCGDSVVAWVTPSQLQALTAELERMGSDPVSQEVAAAYIGNCLLRAAAANNRQWQQVRR